MNFTSFQFALFFLIVFILHWFVFSNKIKWQNFLLLVASYIFYAWWNWRFLGLLVVGSSIPFFMARALEKTRDPFIRKVILMISIFINLGILGFFKYYNFFVNSFIDGFASIGIHLHATSLKIILPVGISFYTFTAVGYMLDIYNQKIRATSDHGVFFLFIGFFPHLLAGPIGRATTLLQQFENKRKFDYSMAVDGCRQILWGLFKKIVIADSVAVYADRIFNNFNSLTGSTVFIGMVYYGIQIYADFSGYSDMAVGMGKMLGINLMKNFAYPYFSVNISEFWRRWHISLSFWFRDYLFLPLAYAVSRRIKSEKILFIKAESLAYGIGIIFTWTLVGLWHGANWNYVIWGLLHGLMLLSYHYIKRNKTKYRINFIARYKRTTSLISILITFILVQITWVIFRTGSISQAIGFLSRISQRSLFSRPLYVGTYLYTLLIAVMTVEWLQRKREHALQIDGIKYRFLRWSAYYSILFLVLFFISREQNFIYLQF